MGVTLSRNALAAFWLIYNIQSISLDDLQMSLSSASVSTLLGLVWFRSRKCNNYQIQFVLRYTMIHRKRYIYDLTSDHISILCRLCFKAYTHTLSPFVAFAKSTWTIFQSTLQMVYIAICHCLVSTVILVKYLTSMCLYVSGRFASEGLVPGTALSPISSESWSVNVGERSVAGDSRVWPFINSCMTQQSKRSTT